MSTTTSIQLPAVTFALKQLLEKKYGERLAKVILFGSYARGEQRPDSDLDFMILLKDDTINRYVEIKNIAAEVAALELKYQIPLSTHFRTHQKFNSTNNMFFNNVKKDGIVL